MDGIQHVMPCPSGSFFCFVTRQEAPEGEFEAPSQPKSFPCRANISALRRIPKKHTPAAAASRNPDALLRPTQARTKESNSSRETAILAARFFKPRQNRNAVEVHFQAAEKRSCAFLLSCHAPHRGF